ncbi:MAG: UDP-N-acetylmuramoyl-L-alanine--D-glutamate ligase [Clostridiales bacterium]|nr:UDP-N-acetylmuramoyl-L-alanine--D-glutamate ligase [Clostridiales bacterium]
MDLYHQKFLVLGVSKSGKAVGDYILKRGCKCYFYEELTSPKIDDAISELTNLGGVFVQRENVDKCLEEVDVIILSPGVPINHRVVIKAKSLNKKIIGELEFGFLQFIPNIVAVTGTNGKTTTVSMINHILNRSGGVSRAVGNVGYPLTLALDDIKVSDVLVAEISSFQLETFDYFKPHISCVLNITPDHLDRHYTMDNYVFLKKRILKNLTESEYAVLNYDDDIVRGFLTDLKAKPVLVSVKQKVLGAYSLDNKLYYNDEFIMETSELSLCGKHNEYNALFVIAVCSLLGVKVQDIKEGLKSFKGVPHRLELIFEKDGIRYVNDSKSTNTGATISALSSITSDTVLILGGSDKGENYIELFNQIKLHPVKHVVLTGDTRFKMLADSTEAGYNEVSVTKNFDTAVKIARLFATSGDTVLLSPACASFDSFSSYENRGKRFAEVVTEL